MSAAVEAILVKLGDYGLKKQASGWIARCPAHDDANPSLSINEGRDQPVLLKCRAGCTTEDILRALGLTWADISTEREHRGRAEIVATYPYTDERGTLLFEVVRMVPKTFRQRRPDGNGGWAWSLNGVRRPVYRLPEVLAAIAAGEPVFVVEGEKDVEAIRRAGAVATCNSGGAGKWTPDHTATLAGASVVVVADRDPAGWRHAQQVANALETVASSVRCAQPLDGCKDVTNHLAAGHGLPDLVEVFDRWESELVDQAALDQLVGAANEPDQETTLDRLRRELLDGDAIEHLPPPEPLVADLLDLDSLAVIFGRPGAGKTHIAIDVALHVATGAWWHGHEVHPGHVLYVVAEGARGVGQRQRAWKLVNHSPGPLAGRITWLPVPVNLLGLDQAQALADIAAEHDVALVVIDTLGRSMAGGDENAFRDMSVVIDAAERIRRATGACVWLVHHSGKDQSAGSRGHSSLLGAVTTELEVRNAGDGIITLATTKQKDRPDDAMPMRFVLVPAAGSVALAPYTGRNAPGDTNITTKDQAMLDALRAIATPGGIPRNAWIERATADDAPSGKIAKTTAYDAIKRLLYAGLVRNLGSEKQPRYMPAEQVEP